MFQYVAGRYEFSVFRRSTSEDRFLTVIGKGSNPGHAVFAFSSMDLQSLR